MFNGNLSWNVNSNNPKKSVAGLIKPTNNFPFLRTIGIKTLKFNLTGKLKYIHVKAEKYNVWEHGEILLSSICAWKH